MSTAANNSVFDGDKKVTPQDRFELVLMAATNRSVVQEFPDLLPGVKTLLELNAQLLMRIAE